MSESQSWKVPTPITEASFREFQRGLEFVLPQDLEVMEGIFHPVPGLRRETQLLLTTISKAAFDIQKDLPSARFEKALGGLVDLLRPVPDWRHTYLSYDFEEGERRLKMILKPIGFGQRSIPQGRNERVEITLFVPRPETRRDWESAFLYADPAKVASDRPAKKADFEFKVNFDFFGFAAGRQGIELRAKDDKVEVSGYDIVKDIEAKESGTRELTDYLKDQPVRSLFSKPRCPSGQEKTEIPSCKAGRTSFEIPYQETESAEEDEEEGEELKLFATCKNWLTFSLKDLFTQGEKAATKLARKENQERLRVLADKKKLVRRQ